MNDKNQMIDEAIMHSKRTNNNPNTYVDNSQYNLRNSSLNGKKVIKVKKGTIKTAFYTTIGVLALVSTLATSKLYTDARARLYNSHGYDSTITYSGGYTSYQKRDKSVEDYKPTTGEIIDEMFRGR